MSAGEVLLLLFVSYILHLSYLDTKKTFCLLNQTNILTCKLDILLFLMFYQMLIVNKEVFGMLFGTIKQKLFL